MRSQDPRCLRLGAALRFAVADLMHQRWTVLANIVALAASTFVFVTLVYYVTGVQRHQAAELAKSLSTRLEVFPIRLDDAGLRLTAPRMDELRSLPGVADVFARVDVNARLSLVESAADGALASIGELLPVQGSPPGDAALAPDRMAWGRGFMEAKAERELVLGLDELAKLGGGLLDTGPTHRRAVIEVERVRRGQSQPLRLECEVVGVVGRKSDQRALIPLALARHLDQWLAFKTDTLPGEAAESEETAIPSLRLLAFGDPLHEGGVAEEERQFAVRAERLGEIQVDDSAGQVWVEVQLDAHGNLGDQQRDLEALAGHRPFPMFHQDGMVALADNDPRWSQCGGGHPSYLTVVRPAGAPHPIPGLTSAPRRFDPHVAGLPEADGYISFETLRRLRFDPLRDGDLVRGTVVATQNIEAAAALAYQFRVAVAANQECCWAVFRYDPMTRDEMPRTRLPTAAATSRGDGATSVLSLVTALQRQVVGRSGIKVALVTTESVDLPDSWPVPADAARRLRIRYLPESLLGMILGVSPAALQADRCLLGLVAGGERIDHSVPLRIRGRELRVQRRLEQGNGELWLARCHEANYPAEHGVAIWGPWASYAALDKLVEGRAELTLEAASRPSHFRALLAISRDQCPRRLEPLLNQCELDECLLLRVGRNEVAGGRRESPRPKYLGCLTSPAGAPADSPLSPDGTPLSDVEWMGWQELGARAYETTRTQRERPLTPDSYAVSFPSSLECRRFQWRTAQRSWQVKVLTPQRPRTLAMYAVERADEQGATIPIPAETVAGLATALPTFEAIMPEVRVPAVVGGVETSLLAVDDSDPRLFIWDLLVGELPANDSTPAVLLPKDLAERLAPGGDLRPLVNSTIALRVVREGARSAAGDLELPLRVAGVTTHSEPLVPAGLVASLALWREGRRMYSVERGVFESPAAVYDRQGAIRCVVDARDNEAVEPLVQRLMGMGYEVRHQLGTWQTLRSMALTLTMFAGAFIGVSLLQASFVVVTAAWTSISGKRHEIGILKSLGIGRFEIVRVYMLEGALVGACAFVLGAGLAVLSEPLLRPAVRELLAPGVLTSLPAAIWSASMVWAYAAALSIAVGFSVAGGAWPAWLFTRLRTAEALRRR